jgi:hypothetical protein
LIEIDQLTASKSAKVALSHENMKTEKHSLNEIASKGPTDCPSKCKNEHTIT